ncbi:MAG: hypothetical protein V1720_04695 [bacterium]
MKRILLFLFIFAAISVKPVFSQDDTQHEVSWDVPELFEFHDVIYQVWHTAWPEKNINLLTELTPDIISGIEKVTNAKLPGILRDKETKWKEEITNLNSIKINFKDAIEKRDSIKILDEAEKLHAQFEKLVRTIRPMVKELDAYHQVLYMLYHYYIPDYNYDKVKASVEELLIKMQDLNKAVLPERLAAKTADFDAARKNLSTSLNALNDAVINNIGQDKIKAAVEVMHSNYQKVEAVFD